MRLASSARVLPTPDPDLTVPDKIVLQYLYNEVYQHDDPTSVPSSSSSSQPSSPTSSSTSSELDSSRTAAHLLTYNDPTSTNFQPTVWTLWDPLPSVVNPLIKTYINWAQTIVRHPTDVVFLSHLLLYFFTVVPSGLYLLFGTFRYIHAIIHLVYTVWCTGAYVLLLHNHSHGNGLLKARYAWIDTLFPYVLAPFMGQTWNSYYYHHCKMHHAEGNGPDDISTTLTYQRDSVYDLLRYIARFNLCGWYELPYYFWSKGQRKFMFKFIFWELSSMGLLVFVGRTRGWKEMGWVFGGMLGLSRVGLMVGNFGQHAFVSWEEPTSDFRSSITLVDSTVRFPLFPSFFPIDMMCFRFTYHALAIAQSNKHCFNDGYHTSHHLNPLRHWRLHPSAFITQFSRYKSEDALVFTNIDYMLITFRLVTNNYEKLADCFVPIGEEQMKLSREEVKSMLKSRTKKFEKTDLERAFGKEGKKE